MAGKESFELDNGLPDDYEIVVERAEFGYRDVYRGGEVPLLILYCASPETETREELFSMGSGWEVVPGGERVEGKDKFPASSWLGRLIVRCNELDMPGFDGGDNGTVLDFIADRGTAQEAHIWVGLKFRMKREEADFGEQGKKTHIMPTECLGLLTAVDAAAFARSTDEVDDFADDDAEVDFDAPGEGKVEQLADPEPEPNKQDEVMLAVLKPLAVEADTAIAFQVAAVSAGILKDEWLLRVMDAEKAEQLYEELRG